MPRKRSPHEAWIINLFWKVAEKWTGGAKNDLDPERAIRATREVMQEHVEEGVISDDILERELEDMLACLIHCTDTAGGREAVMKIVADSWEPKECFKEPKNVRAQCRSCKTGGNYMKDFFDEESPTGAKCPRCGSRKINVGEDIPF